MYEKIRRICLTQTGDLMRSNLRHQRNCAITAVGLCNAADGARHEDALHLPLYHPHSLPGAPVTWVATASCAALHHSSRPLPFALRPAYATLEALLRLGDLMTFFRETFNVKRIRVSLKTTVVETQVLQVKTVLLKFSKVEGT